MTPPEDRSPIAIGFEWASRIFVAGLTFVVPILLGHGLDRIVGSTPLGLLAGLVVGLVVGLSQLIRIAQAPRQPRS